MISYYQKQPLQIKFIHKDICNPMFIAALFLVAKMKKIPKYPTWRRYGTYIYNEILLGNRKRWNNAICENMGESWNYHAMQNKPDKKFK